jgi:hypothetical protein
MGSPKDTRVASPKPARVANAQKQHDQLVAARQRRVEALAKKLEEEVEQFISDGLNLWVDAAHQAINDYREPVEEESVVYWFVALGGNLLWASTAFYPEAKLATQMASVFGSIIGSGTVAQVKNLTKMLNESASERPAREYVADEVAERADQWEKHLVSGAGEWIRTRFINALISMQGLKLRQQIGDHTFEQVMDQLETPSAQSRNERRHAVYEEYIFPGLVTDWSLGQHDAIRKDLRVAMTQEMQRALASFNSQARLYQRTLKEFENRYGRYRDEYEQTHPFTPRLDFSTKVHGSGAPDRRTAESG